MGGMTGRSAAETAVAAICTLIETCKLNAADLRAWLPFVLARISNHPAEKIVSVR